MSANPEVENRLDSVKWIAVFALLATAIGGNIYYQDQLLAYRVLGVAAITAIACLVAVQTAKGAAFWQLLKEARMEIRKVVWPTRQETTQTTLMVVVVVLVMALILWGMDTLLGWLTSLIIG